MRVRNQKKREFRFVFGSCVLFGVLLCAALMNMVNDFNNGNFNGRMLESNDTDDNSTTCGEDIQERFECEEEDCEDNANLVNYMDIYYCSVFSKVKPLMFIIYVLLTLFLLYILGDTADDYFCSNLESIVVKLKIPPATAGVTFLSFGNGAPDVFSLVVSFFHGQYELGVGAILGAGIFVTTVVVGGVVLVSKVIVNPKSFYRDTGFYLVAIAYLFFVFYDKDVAIWEALLFLGIYITFVVVAIWSGYKTKDPIIKQGLLENEIENGIEKVSTTANNGEGSDNNSTTATTGTTPTAANDQIVNEEDNLENECKEVERILSNKNEVLNSGAILNVMVRTKIAMRQNRSLSENYSYKAELKTGLKIDRRRILTTTSHDKYQNHPIDKERDSIKWKHIFTKEAMSKEEGDLTIPEESSSLQPESLELPKSPTEQEEQPIRTIKTVIYDDLKDIKQSGWMIVIKAIELPLTLLRQFTIPTVDDEIYCRYQNMISLFLFPIFLAYFGGLPIPLWSIPIYLALGILISGSITYFCKDEEPPMNKLLNLPILLISFVCNVLWIYIIANEVVNVLVTIGHILSIRQAILGMTVLSWGNSLGDLISDIAVARQGFPTMAIAGTYAGPLFNMLFGLGTGLTIESIREGKANMIDGMGDVGITVTYISFFFLFGSLAVTMITCLICKFELKKWYSIVLFLFYGVYLTFNLLVSLQIIPLIIKF